MLERILKEWKKESKITNNKLHYKIIDNELILMTYRPFMMIGKHGELKGKYVKLLKEQFNFTDVKLYQLGNYI